MTCPCGLGETLESCCGPYLKHEKKPPTAEALMRARYTAYATGDVDFIVESHDPERKGEVDNVLSKAAQRYGVPERARRGGCQA